MVETRLTPPFLEPLDPAQAQRHADTLIATWKKRFWTPEELNEAKQLLEATE